MIHIIKDENDEANIPKSESDLLSFFDYPAIEREDTSVFIIGQIESVVNNHCRKSIDQLLSNSQQ